MSLIYYDLVTRDHLKSSHSQFAFLKAAFNILGSSSIVSCLERISDVMADTVNLAWWYSGGFSIRIDFENASTGQSSARKLRRTRGHKGAWHGSDPAKPISPPFLVDRTYRNGSRTYKCLYERKCCQTRSIDSH